MVSQFQGEERAQALSADPGASKPEGLGLFEMRQTPRFSEPPASLSNLALSDEGTVDVIHPGTWCPGLLGSAVGLGAWEVTLDPVQALVAGLSCRLSDAGSCVPCRRGEVAVPCLGLCHKPRHRTAFSDDLPFTRLFRFTHNACSKLPLPHGGVRCPWHRQAASFSLAQSF